jgi:hypothetical protein
LILQTTIDFNNSALALRKIALVGWALRYRCVAVAEGLSAADLVVAAPQSCSAAILAVYPRASVVPQKGGGARPFSNKLDRVRLVTIS